MPNSTGIHLQGSVFQEILIYFSRKCLLLQLILNSYFTISSYCIHSTIFKCILHVFQAFFISKPRTCISIFPTNFGNIQLVTILDFFLRNLNTNFELDEFQLLALHFVMQMKTNFLTHTERTLFNEEDFCKQPLLKLHLLIFPYQHARPMNFSQLFTIQSRDSPFLLKLKLKSLTSRGFCVQLLAR